MPKLKTKKGVAKRFKLTRKGKVKHPASGKSHLLSGKNSGRLRRLRGQVTLKNKRVAKFIKEMLPYG